MRLMKGAMHMESNNKIINLKKDGDKSYLVFPNNDDIKLDLSGNVESDIESFFRLIIRMLVTEPKFNLVLKSDGESSGLVEEVAEKYIERLNIEISSICANAEFLEIKNSEISD